MRIHYKLNILGPLPILKVFQVSDKSLVFKIPILSQIMNIDRISQALDEFQLEKEALAAIVRVLVRVLRSAIEFTR